jgi:hypothetical protein
MKLHDLRAIHPDLLPGLLNTALRNDCEDLDDLARAHDLEREEIEARMAELGYRYRAEFRQFRPTEGGGATPSG